MSVDKNMARLEKLAKEIENEKGFDRSLEIFYEAAPIVKEILVSAKEQKGKVTEVIKEIEGIIERDLKLADDEE